jgi:hypothetical protein
MNTRTFACTYMYIYITYKVPHHYDHGGKSSNYLKHPAPQRQRHQRNRPNYHDHHEPPPVPTPSQEASPMASHTSPVADSPVLESRTSNTIEGLRKVHRLFLVEADLVARRSSARLALRTCLRQPLVPMTYIHMAYTHIHYRRLY